VKVIGEGSWKRLPMQIVILGFLKIVFLDYFGKCTSVIFTEDCNSVIFTEIAILKFLLKIVIP